MIRKSVLSPHLLVATALLACVAGSAFAQDDTQAEKPKARYMVLPAHLHPDIAPPAYRSRAGMVRLLRWNELYL